MSVIETTRPAAASRGYIATVFANAFSAILDWNEKRATKKALSKLSLRELDDIGLTPADIARM